MGDLRDAWEKAKDPRAVKEWALNKGSTRDKKPYFQNDRPSTVNPGIMESMFDKPQPRYGVDEQRDRAMIRHRGMGPNSQPPMGGGGDDFFSSLMDQIQGEYGGVDKSKVDFSSLDSALKSRMDAINGIRTNANENFKTSDANLEGMHRAFQDNINTEGAQRFNTTADNAKTQLTNVNADSQQRLQAIKADDIAKRQAMLQNLGIEESGATPDESANALTQAQASIASRNEGELANVEQDRNTNLAFNNKIATSVGQQGVERRAALQQQLQGILGKLGMAEADAQGQDAQSRFSLEQNAGNQQYQQWRDRQGFLQDTLGMMQDDARKQAEAAQGGDPLKVGGFSGLAQDLVNTGYEVPEIQNAMSTLSQITSSDYRKGVDPNAGYSEADVLNKILQSRGIDPTLAIQLATNYANLGNTSSYEQR